MYMYMYIFINMCIYAYGCVYMRACVCIYACVRAYKCVCVCVLNLYITVSHCNEVIIMFWSMLKINCY